ncbi:PREDICTED: kinesin-like protein KIF14, partial [Tinamus guttatus]|uniref:kinesin-like protein KIF14 n=1 Tax=Tinamus guttatus TaxID=94827 RepID=UPI00052E8D32
SLNKSSICPSSSELFIPGICKESVSSALDLLEQNHEGGKSIADNLLTSLFTIFTGVSAISKAYEQQDEDCQENIFLLDRAAQSYSIRIISAFDQLVVLTKLWLDNVSKCSTSIKTEEELKQEVKNLGGYLQLLLQGCSSDISSMVMEAWNKVDHTIRQIMKYIGQLAVLRRTDIFSSEENSIMATCLQDIEFKYKVILMLTFIFTVLESIASSI